MSDIKDEMLKIKQNLHEESHFIEQDIQNAVKENAEHPNLSSAESEVSKIQSTGQQLLQDIPKILEVERSLQDEG